MHTFEAGKGINAVKINENFTEVMKLANDNEASLLRLSQTALLKDGSNLSQDVVDKFKQDEPNILIGDGMIALADNTANFLTLTGNGTILLPNIAQDQYSHTMTLVVSGSEYALDLGTTKHLLNPVGIDTTQAYNVLYIYNKLDNSWYYSITQ